MILSSDDIASPPKRSDVNVKGSAKEALPFDSLILTTVYSG
jgi:hypothetical protein